MPGPVKRDLLPQGRVERVRRRRHVDDGLSRLVIHGQTDLVDVRRGRRVLEEERRPVFRNHRVRSRLRDARRRPRPPIRRTELHRDVGRQARIDDRHGRKIVPDHRPRIRLLKRRVVARGDVLVPPVTERARIAAPAPRREPHGHDRQRDRCPTPRKSRQGRRLHRRHLVWRSWPKPWRAVSSNEENQQGDRGDQGGEKRERTEDLEGREGKRR